MARATAIAALFAAVVATSASSSSTTSPSTTTSTSTTSCPTVLTPTYADPVVGVGWTAQLVVSGLDTPRSLLFDASGSLLVVQSGVGILRLSFDDYGGTCLVVAANQTVVADADINHGIALSADGTTIYASTAENVYAWPYDAATGTVGSTRQTLVTNMTNTDHTSRTLLLSRYAPANTTLLLVSRGSAENLDLATAVLDTGRSQIRAFDVAATRQGAWPYDYATAGTVVGWGLRNSVGLAEEPVTGGLFSVENSADDIVRAGQDIHTDDPGEELNAHGRLNDSANTRLGAHYGYPHCFALWGGDIPDVGSLVVGDQFALVPNATLNDTTCAADYLPPRLTLQAHVAPLNLLFAADGTDAYVSLHGSWDRDDPVGYKVVAVAFADGEPVVAADSRNGTRDVLANPDLSVCPGRCFRPVGLALDDQGRLFVGSDATGEIYVLQANAAASTTATATSSGTLVTSAATSAAHLADQSLRNRLDSSWWVYAVLGVVAGIAVAA